MPWINIVTNNDVHLATLPRILIGIEKTKKDIEIICPEAFSNSMLENKARSSKTSAYRSHIIFT